MSILWCNCRKVN